MNNLFYPKLALMNIKKNRKIYYPYILTCIFDILVFYMLASLANNQGLKQIVGGDALATILGIGQYVTGFFSILFLFYTNSFLMKRRKKEFGLFNVLGMGKNHLAKVIFLESMFIFMISLFLGIFLGIVLDKLAFLSLLKFFTKDIPLGFQISISAIKATVLLFSITFLLILIYSLIQLFKTKPIELLKSESTGEKEPKSNWLFAILGIVCLIAAYYISITTKHPITAINLFFVAVMLVIVGTYFIFTSTSIVILKIMRKNHNYYYKTKHFISVSSMIYRMKQNAAGIANICILSTMVLVMISTTSSLWMGTNDLVDNRYPTDFAMTCDNQEDLLFIQNSIQTINTQLNATTKDEIYYQRLQLVINSDKNHFYIDTIENYMDDIDTIYSLVFVPLDDYNRANDSNYTLNNNEILLYSVHGEYQYETLLLDETTYNIKEKLKAFKGSEGANTNLTNTILIVVKDNQVFETINQRQKTIYGDKAKYPTYFYSFNLDGNDDFKIEYGATFKELLANSTNYIYIEQKAVILNEFISLYAGLFFIGIFLSLVFIIATILIMYYKQVSEGYEDKKRFEIMRNVGLSTKDIKKSISSQILFIFFLPLITAGIHISFAFPVINRLMNLLYFDNIPLFIKVSIACFLIFSVFYAIVYKFTAKIYYKVVNN